MLQQRLGSNFQNPTRNNFITLSDIRRIEKGIEAEKIRFNPDDGISVAQWAAKLHSADSLLGFKSRLCPVPPGSGLRDLQSRQAKKTGVQERIIIEYRRCTISTEVQDKRTIRDIAISP